MRYEIYTSCIVQDTLLQRYLCVLLHQASHLHNNKQRIIYKKKKKKKITILNKSKTTKITVTENLAHNKVK